ASALIVMLVLNAVPVPADAEAPLSEAQERALKAKDAFKECDECPDMIVVAAGSFMMGSPQNEDGRERNEGPLHAVKIAQPFALGRLEVTLDQFAAFVQATGRDMGNKCDVWEDNQWAEKAGRSWRNPGFAQSGNHPVTCVSWDDGKAYVAWLAQKTGKPYRLAPEAAGENGARAGTKSRYSFGNSDKELCRYGNGADVSARKTVPGARTWDVVECDDGYAYTAPAGSFNPNGFGLFDMHGNVFEWTEDCWHETY